MDEQFREWAAFEKANPIPVEAELQSPHPILWRTAQRIGFPVPPPALAQPSGDDRWFDIDASPERMGRALCIADALLKACELRGFEWQPLADGANQPVALVIDGHPIPIRLREKGHPVPHLSLNAWGTWNDCISRPLTKRLNSVILSLRRDVARREESKRNAERYQRRMEELNSARDTLRAEVEAEREAVDELLLDSENWERARSIRAYIAAVEAEPPPRGKRNARKAWIIWANAQADRLDPLCVSPASVLDIPCQRGRVRQRGVISGVLPGRIVQAALGVICSGGTSSICGVTRAAMPSICI